MGEASGRNQVAKLWRCNVRGGLAVLVQNPEQRVSKNYCKVKNKKIGCYLSN
jgi:hypothetical protein